MMARYAEYKDSGVDWLGEIPAGWEVKRMKFLYRDVSEKNRAGAELLSVTQSQGVVPRSWVENRMVMPSGNLGSFKFIKEGDFAISLRSFEGGLEYCHHDGIISPAYTVLKSIRNDLFRKYYKFLFKSLSFISEIQTSVVGIREGKNISFEELSYSLMPLPPLPEQTAIARFLDDKVARIEALVGIKRRQIELLAERKQILIQNAVTQGLNPDAPMKDSDVDWIGTIPAHWEVKRVKHLLDERNERSENGNEPLLMVSQVHGLVVRADFHSKSEVSATSIGNKIVHENDLVFNKLKAHLGVFFKSKIQDAGIVSPDYAVYVPSETIPDSQFFEILFRHPVYIAQFIVRATGIVEGLIRLYTSELFDIPVAVPPQNEQQEIISFCATVSINISDLITLKQNQITKLTEYKTTLINAAVTGKIKVAGE